MILKYKWLLLGAGIVIGAISGYAYWYFVGCYSGTCAISSQPLNSTLYGTLMGGLLVNLFLPEKPKK
ncbi:MAG: hypothetical protein EAZ55_02090 [Cytophagales bacterium]|nr:MAG: hypothetical protein EAZ55_02090 [Cytophagales bacterium]